MDTRDEDFSQLIYGKAAKIIEKDDGELIEAMANVHGGSELFDALVSETVNALDAMSVKLYGNQDELAAVGEAFLDYVVSVIVDMEVVGDE